MEKGQVCVWGRVRSVCREGSGLCGEGSGRLGEGSGLCGGKGHGEGTGGGGDRCPKPVVMVRKRDPGRLSVETTNRLRQYTTAVFAHWTGLTT